VQGKRTCTFRLLTGASSAEAKADEAIDIVSRHKTEIHQTRHDVPVGTAVRVSYRYESLPDVPRAWQHQYYLDVPIGVASVYCWGDPPATDRWLSIVEAIAPLPAEGVAMIPFDPRVEVPEHGLAVDFGAEWEVSSANGWPGMVAGGDNVLPARSPTGGDCWLEDDTHVARLAEVRSLDDWRAVFIEAADWQRFRGTLLSPGGQPGELTMADAGLSSTNGVRAHWETWRVGCPATAWIFLDGERRAVLFCRATMPPEDRWLSIAETFQFLPAEE